MDWGLCCHNFFDDIGKLELSSEQKKVIFLVMVLIPTGCVLTEERRDIQLLLQRKVYKHIVMMQMWWMREKCLRCRKRKCLVSFWIMTGKCLGLICSVCWNKMVWRKHLWWMECLYIYLQYTEEYYWYGKGGWWATWVEGDN